LSRQKPGPKDEMDVVRRLGTEAGLSRDDAMLYLRLLHDGGLPLAQAGKASTLLDRGMAIVSGDGKRVIPVHPRLGIANYYRTWREAMVREINERRMRIDKLILELIPVYEAATEKSMGTGGR
jgi:hypothetical protein